MPCSVETAVDTTRDLKAKTDTFAWHQNCMLDGCISGGSIAEGLWLMGAASSHWIYGPEIEKRRYALVHLNDGH